MDLLIYAPELDLNQENSRVLQAILERYENRDCGVILQTEQLDEYILFQYADAFITTRVRETVFRICLADLYQVKILYGTDEPVFPQ